MIPFKELLNPVTGVMDRIPWDPAKANVKLQEFRQAHLDRLNAEDCELAEKFSIGHMVKDGMLQTLEVSEGVSRDDRETVVGRDSHYVVNPVASQIKHTGAMLSDAFIPEWREFCSKPQNDDNVEYSVRAYVPKAIKGRTLPVARRKPQEVEEEGGEPVLSASAVEASTRERPRRLRRNRRSTGDV